MLLQNLIIADGVIALGIGVLLGVFVIDAINLRAFEDCLAVHLIGTQGRGGIGRKIGVTGPCSEDDDAFLFQVADSAATDIWLGNLIHADGADNAAMDTKGFQRGLHAKRVHHGRQHAHIVSGRTFHPLGASLKAAEDVAATDDHADLDTKVMNRFHLAGDTRNGRRMQTIALIPHQGLARNLQQNAGIAGCVYVLLIRHRVHPESCFIGTQNVAKRVHVQPAETDFLMSLSDGIDPERHVVIAGPTASGKSALAMHLAETQGGTVVNADALQIWACWRVLTARPSSLDETRVPHALYGHVSPGHPYSVGDWLTQVATLPGRLIIVGGTGLYLNALTRGLAPIPPTPAHIRAEGDNLLASQGLAEMVDQLDPESRASIDTRNPARVQRAWEVLRATGRGISAWQAETPAPLVAPDTATLIQVQSDRDWLAERIARRFDQMLTMGALEEVRAMLPLWNPSQQWTKAIGAPEMVAHLRGETSLTQARDLSVIATRQYAKSQRIWFRGKMRDWRIVAGEEINHILGN